MAENTVKTAIDTVKGIVEAVPIYQDAVQPAAREVGKALQTLTKAIHIALAPVSALIWGYEKISDYLSVKLTEKLKEVPEDRLATPSPSVAGPVLEAMRFTSSEEILRDLYATLLATAIDTETAKHAHPAFVPVLAQLTADEARLLKTMAGQVTLTFPIVDLGYFGPNSHKYLYRGLTTLSYESDCIYPEQIGMYVNNLCRLGLATVGAEELVDKSGYDTLEGHPVISQLKRSLHEWVRGKFSDQNSSMEVRFTRRTLQLTEFGWQFLNACVLDHGSPLPTPSEGLKFVQGIVPQAATRAK